jgi:hypothetical protein
MKKLSPVAIFVALILFACGGSPSTEESTPVVYSGNTVVGVTHTVKDFAAWLKVYQAKSDSNSRVSLYVSPEDPNLVTVFELTVSHEDAKKMFASEDLKKVMQEAGVSSEPVFMYFDMKYRNMEKSPKKYRVLVSHEVADYDAWKKVFDADAPRRAEASLELRALSTDADNPKMVYIMFATEDANQAKGMMDTDDLKAKMKEAGVISEPKVTVLMMPPAM